MKSAKRLKCILAVLLLGILMCAECFAEVTITDTPVIGAAPVSVAAGPVVSDTAVENSNVVNTSVGPTQRFPFELATDVASCDRLCYAGHMANGGIFYNDGKIVPAGAKFCVASAPGGEDRFSEVTVDITLLYENPQNTGCTKEILRKYPQGHIEQGKYYEIFSEQALRSLAQRKKLYSSDLSSIRVTVTCGNLTKSQLFYIAKDTYYQEALLKK